MRTDIVIAYHLGAPYTDEEQVFKSFQKDPELLEKNGFLVRLPREYRRLINRAIEKTTQQDATPQEQELLLSTLTNQSAVGRLLLTNGKFLGVPSWMFNQSKFYQNAGLRTNELRNLFPDNPCEFFLSIRNPATFIPEAFLGQKNKNYEQFISDIVLENIRWSDVIRLIQLANPDCPITVWCNEDTPIIWSTVLCELAGVEHQTRFEGDLDILRGIISTDGNNRLEQYLAERPSLNEMQRRRVKAVFLEKFVVSDAVEIEIDLPGWTDETIVKMTDVYEDDIETIERMPGVNFISP
ncbi:MAG: hypothetical protein ACU0C9_12435 [Paracoccaceae bacterium]